MPQPGIAGFTAEAFRQLTTEPRRYGAHATLKPPFHPAADHDDRTIGDGVAKLAATLVPVVMPPLRATRIGRFLALTPERQEPALAALAAACVRALDHLRAPTSPEELAKLPAHMRTARDCRRSLQPYLLEVAVDDRAVLLDTVVARGAESDRPLSVLQRLPLAPGRHEVKVEFTPLALAGDGPGVEAARLELEAHVVVSPRQVVLVTLAENQRELVVAGRR